MIREQLYSPAEVALMWSCSAKQVRHLIAAEQLQAINISPNSARPTWRIAAIELSRFQHRQQRIEPIRVRRQKRAVVGTQVIEFVK